MIPPEEIYNLQVKLTSCSMTLEADCTLLQLASVQERSKEDKVRTVSAVSKSCKRTVDVLNKIIAEIEKMEETLKNG